MDGVLGIDIAKAKFHVTLVLNDGTRRRKVCPNTATGFGELAAWLQRHGAGQVHACLEATGTYGTALATALFDAGHVVSVVNPAVIYHYAKSQLLRSKTDRVDADVIAEYTRTQQPAAWTPMPRDVRELQALVRRLEVLIGMQTEERNREQAGELTAAVRTSISTVLTHLDEQIRAVRAQIRAHIDQHPSLRSQRDLLVSIPGVGDTTAALLLAELFNKSYTSARQAAAFAGVTPRPHESGEHVGRRVMSKVGPARIRKGLYFPAVSALRCNPSLHSLRTRLQRAGKPKLLIIGAAMRKLIHIAFGVLKSGRAYDPSMIRA
jgi:transposase